MDKIDKRIDLFLRAQAAKKHKIFVRESKIDPYIEDIQRLLSRGSTVYQIHLYLRRFCRMDVAYSTVLRYIHSREAAQWVNSPKPRRKQRQS